MSPLPQFGAEHPDGVRVYERDGTFSVSQHQCWLPGIYATEDAAVAAVALPDDALARLATADVRGIGDGYRPITLDEVKAAAIRAAFRAGRDAGVQLDSATPEGETWTAVRFQQAATINAESRAELGDEFLVAQVTTAVRENAEAIGAVVLDEDPECTWTAFRDDMTLDHHGFIRDPKLWLLTVAQRVAVPEGHPALSLDEEAP